MRRGKSDAFQAFDFLCRFKQLHKGRFAVANWDVPLAITGNDLPKKSDFLHSLTDQLSAFIQDVGYRSATFLAPSVRHDAKRTILVAALHDADKSGGGAFGVAVD